MKADSGPLSRFTASVRALPAGGVFALVSGFLLQLSLGGLFTFGNLTTYLTSYLHVQRGQDVGYGQTAWVGTCMSLAEGLALLPGSMLYQGVGPRPVVLLGCLLTSGSIALTSLVVDTSFGWLVVTYGLLNGLGAGFVYGVPLLVGYRWFPQHKGLVSGVVVGGYGLGGILFTTLQTSFLNPDNVSPENDDFFHDPDLLGRVPGIFLLQAGVAAGIQVISLAGIRNPPTQEGEARKTSEGEDKKRIEIVDRVEVEVRGTSIVSLDGKGRAYTLREALQTVAFYQLFLAYVFNCFSVGIINPLWKAFGQQFIKDDHFLELVGSGSSVFNMLGRLSWGVLCDIFGYEPVMVMLSGLFCMLMFTLEAAGETGRGLYLIWIWALFFAFSGTFSIIVTGTANSFGQENTGQIYGMMFAGGAVVGPLVTTLIDLLLDDHGYSLLFLIGGIVTFGTLVATVTFRSPRTL